MRNDVQFHTVQCSVVSCSEGVAAGNAPKLVWASVQMLGPGKRSGRGVGRGPAVPSEQANSAPLLCPYGRRHRRCAELSQWLEVGVGRAAGVMNSDQECSDQ